MVFHNSIEHSPQSSRVVASCHKHDGSELMLVAPRRKHLAFTFGSDLGSGDLHDIRHAKRAQLANLPCARILVREPSTDELVVFSAGRVRKNRNARRDAIVHEVCRFEGPRAAGIERYDYDVSGRDRLVHDECPSCSSQNRLPNGGNSNDGSRGQSHPPEDWETTVALG